MTACGRTRVHAWRSVPHRRGERRQTWERAPSATLADMEDVVTVVGQGLHGGAHASVRFVRERGRVRLRCGELEVHVDDLVLDGASRSTRASSPDGRLRVGTVEHLFAALAAAFVREGVVVEVEGPEVPLADGGARVFYEALERLELPASPPPLVVERSSVFDIGASRYELAPHDGVRLEVEIDFGDRRLETRASWDGDPLDFRQRIAPARTFGFAHEVDALAARGLASHVAPESVVVLMNDRILSAGPTFFPDEPARHKLLDLVGDLYAYGGPPRGVIRATRPGHAATHEAMRRALAAGHLARMPAG